MTSFGLLEWAYVVLSLRRIDLIWVCPCSPLFQAMILLVSEPSPLGLVSNVYNFVFLVYFRLIFLQSRHVLLQMNNHQKLKEIVSSKALCLSLVFILAVLHDSWWLEM